MNKVMQEHVIKAKQRRSKTEQIKIKELFWPYSLFLAPGHSLFWTTLLEDQTRS